MYANGIERRQCLARARLQTRISMHVNRYAQRVHFQASLPNPKKKKEDPGSYEVKEIEFVGAKVSTIVACGDLLDTRNLYGCLYTG